ncbi:MAG: hypothetical protein VYA84_01950, partial [Planctomycetota bacterium]|nr:hypothetical protein [Planctomycetota bacterium]
FSILGLAGWCRSLSMLQRLGRRVCVLVEGSASWSKGLRLGRRVCVLVEGSVSWSWGRVFVAGVSLFVAWSVRPVITGKDRNRDLEI